MAKPFPRVLILSLVISCFATLANADTIPVGDLTFDQNASTATFDITNLTGLNAFPPDFPITTQLTITITSLVAEVQGGGTLSIDGSNFTADPSGDLFCTVAGDAGSGGCNFSAHDLVSATLTGTLSPTTGLAGLPAGDTSIESAFTTTITPSCGPTLTTNCDAALINATTPAPEPATWTPLGILLIGLLVSYRFKRKGEVS